VPVVFEGFVFASDGLPVEGAVVVSSAGATAVTDGAGHYRLEARVPLEAERVWITCVDGSNAVASASVGLPAGSGLAWVDPLRLVSGGTCHPGWLQSFGVQPGPGGIVVAQVVYDDGDGPALYLAGFFSVADGLANLIVRWDGSRWSPLDDGMNQTVRALAVYDDGSGAALYAAGDFTMAGGVAASRIARWDGLGWTAVGSGLDNIAFALDVFDDGSGPALYVGGVFQTAFSSTGAPVPATRIAKWDGSSWSALGSGMDNAVTAFAVYDDGSGPALYAGGHFFTAGGVTVRQVARWNGSRWSAVGGGVGGATNPRVNALTVYDDGSGPKLVAGGYFTTAGGVAANRIATWNGSTWASFGGGVGGSGDSTTMRALAVYDAGDGPALYAGGEFANADGALVNHVAKWNGSNWTELDGGVGNAPFVSFVASLGEFDDGTGPALFVGDIFRLAGNVGVSSIAKWRGSEWAALGHGSNGHVRALSVYDDGAGPALVAGGDFTSVGGVLADRVAKWDGQRWDALGSGVSGPPSPSVRALAVWDSGGGPELYAGGVFATAGGVAASAIAKWNGEAWAALGSGVGGGFPPSVAALLVFDSGTGPELYATGAFETAGGVTAARIARWNGSHWSAVGTGLSSPGLALAVHDDGAGPKLYAGGSFTVAGGVSANRIAKWDGSSWSRLGSGMSGTAAHVSALRVHDDGSGPALYAGGGFVSAGGVAASNVARWDGTAWTALGSGLAGSVDDVWALAVYDDGSGPALYAGGEFTTAGGAAVSNLARWDGLELGRARRRDAEQDLRVGDVRRSRSTRSGAARGRRIHAHTRFGQLPRPLAGLSRLHPARARLPDVHPRARSRPAGGARELRGHGHGRPGSGSKRRVPTPLGELLPVRHDARRVQGHGRRGQSGGLLVPGDRPLIVRSGRSAASVGTGTVLMARPRR
jgi:hypothetical protein